MNAPLTLASVLQSWNAAKEAERVAIEHRRALDRLITQMLPTKDEGTVSQKEGDYKVTVTYKLDRRLDTAQLQTQWPSLHKSAQDAIRWKAELNASEFRKLSSDISAKLAEFMTTKPASPSVSVEIITQE